MIINHLKLNIIKNYPKKIKVTYFIKDEKDLKYELYATEEIVNNTKEERDFYCSLKHESNTKIEVLPL